MTRRLVFGLQAKRQEEGEHAFDKHLAIAKQLIVGHFVLKIDSDGPVVAGLAGYASHRSSSGQMGSVADDPNGGMPALLQEDGGRRGFTTKSFMKTCVFTPTHETGLLMADIIPYAGSHDTRLGRESSWPLAPAGTHVFSGR
jgi:hypothetical protein